jgi:putative hydrolase
MFGSQIGQAVGVLAGEVVGSTDIGLPLGPAGRAALLPVNMEAFGKDLGVGKDEVRLYLALREAAHQRLFAHVPWLRSHLFGAVEGYARGIKVDTAKLEDVVGQFDPQNPEQLQEALQQGMFQPGTPRRRRPPWPVWRRLWRSSRAGSTRWCTPRRSPACRPPTRCVRPCAAAGPRAVRPSRRSPR